MDRSTTGFRFNGEGYVIIDGKSYLEEDTSAVEFTFSTFAMDGLMFLIGKDNSFLSIELQNGSVFFQVCVYSLSYFMILLKLKLYYF